MDYDNNRDRNSYGYDAGIIVDGKVVKDENTGEYVIIDEDNLAISIQSVLKESEGKEVRLTFIPLESIQEIENLLSTGKH